MEEISFLNVDLDIESKIDIKPILKNLEKEVLVLHHDQSKRYHRSSLELSNYISSPDEVIAYFCHLIESFPANVRKIWDQCCLRTFDIGYESGNYPRAFRSELRASTIEKVVNIGASIIVTIYPINEDTDKQV